MPKITDFENSYYFLIQELGGFLSHTSQDYWPDDCQVLNLSEGKFIPLTNDPRYYGTPRFYYSCVLWSEDPDFIAYGIEKTRKRIGGSSYSFRDSYFSAVNVATAMVTETSLSTNVMRFYYCLAFNIRDPH